MTFFAPICSWTTTLSAYPPARGRNVRCRTFRGNRAGHPAAMLWYLVAGALLFGVAFVGSRIERLALTPAVIYLIVGACLVRALGDRSYRSRSNRIVGTA